MWTPWTLPDGLGLGAHGKTSGGSDSQQVVSEPMADDLWANSDRLVDFARRLSMEGEKSKVDFARGLSMEGEKSKVTLDRARMQAGVLHGGSRGVEGMV